MKIVFIIADPKIQPDTHLGYNSRINSFILGLEANGHRVKPLFAGSAAAQQTAVRLYQSGIRNLFPSFLGAVIRDLYKIYADSRFYRKILKIAREFQPDLIIQRYTYFNFSGGRVARKLGCKLLIDANECVDLEINERPHIRFPIPAFSRKMEKLILKQADFITIPSARFKNYLTHLKIPEERFFVLHNAVHPHKFSVPQDLIKSLKNKFDLNDKIVIGYAGGFDPYQGVMNLVDVAGSIIEAHHNVRFLLVGDGSERPEIIEKIRDQNVSDYFILPGRVPHDEVPGLISLFDIAVLPASNSYGSPIKILEYMGSGKPVIAPDVPPVKEILIDRQEGLLIQNNSAYHLKTMIHYLLKNPDIARMLGENARKKVLSNFIWDQQVNRLLDWTSVE